MSHWGWTVNFNTPELRAVLRCRCAGCSHWQPWSHWKKWGIFFFLHTANAEACQWNGLNGLMGAEEMLRLFTYYLLTSNTVSSRELNHKRVFQHICDIDSHSQGKLWQAFCRKTEAVRNNILSLCSVKRQINGGIELRAIGLYNGDKTVSAHSF